MVEVRIPNLVKSVMFLIPEIKAPIKAVSKIEKIMWTVNALIIYLLCCQIPLYGIYKSSKFDPLYFIRDIIASNRGTLMELGITPIIMSSIIMPLIFGGRVKDKYFEVVENTQKEERDTLLAAKKLFAFVFTILQATTYVTSGLYGDLKNIGALNTFLIIIQLVVAVVIVLLLDELLSKGYGIGSGVSLFIVAYICKNIFWKVFSPFTIRNDNGNVEYEGAVVAAVHLLLANSNKIAALREAFYRVSSTNLHSLIATIFVFFIVTYFQGFKYEIKIFHKNEPARNRTYPIKLFYSSNIPILFQNALSNHIFFYSQIFYKRYKTNFLIKLLGQWKVDESGDNPVPIGGLVYYIFPPMDLLEIVNNPFHTIFYISYILISCVIFSQTWIQFSRSGANDVANKLRKKGYIIETDRNEKIQTVFKKYIPIATTFGGMFIGVLKIFADILGSIESGTGILIAVTTIYSYYEELIKEEDKF